MLDGRVTESALCAFFPYTKRPSKGAVVYIPIGLVILVLIIILLIYLL